MVQMSPICLSFVSQNLTITNLRTVLSGKPNVKRWYFEADYLYSSRDTFQLIILENDMLCEKRRSLKTKFGFLQSCIVFENKWIVGIKK
ncbi:hypothetical protein HNY73_005061 [Argiope bruennichi]|uniref:Uncharacterized protein n=1 Tax=Argiope bruennichi TaxID=94029 RepID=A0A8T0FF82_ARGBR|nr:hypothetical protein HNY73_005061 [Argiope bruennichi]